MIPLHQTFDHRVRYLFYATLAFAAYAVGCELYWAPLKPGGSLLALKVLPLVVLLPGLFKGKFRSLQALCMLILIYAAEGFVRAMSDPPAVRKWGWISALLSTLIFFGTMWIARSVKQAKKNELKASNSDVASLYKPRY